jgi:AhpD family alkylhydroperoxidase
MEEIRMTRKEIYAQAEQMLGGVPGWLSETPDGAIEQFWATFTWLFSDTKLSGRDKALVALGAAVVLHCKYCIPFHTAQVAMHGIAGDQIKEASWAANSVAGFGSYLHGIGYDLDRFLKELDGAVKHITSQAGQG